MPGDILSSSFRTTFEETLTPSQQQQAIDSLLDYIHEVQYGTEEQRLDLGVIEDDDVDAEVISRKLNATLEKCYWQLVMFLRVRAPVLSVRASCFAFAYPCVCVCVFLRCVHNPCVTLASLRPSASPCVFASSCVYPCVCVFASLRHPCVFASFCVTPAFLRRSASFLRCVCVVG